MWLDQNSNGMQDSGEPGLAGIVVRLHKTTPPQTMSSTTTDSTGQYQFTGVDANTYYYLKYVLPVGYVYTVPDAGPDSIDSDTNPATGRTPGFYVMSGEYQNWDTGFTVQTSNDTPEPDPEISTASTCASSSYWELGNRIWRERNGDADYDSWIDEPLPGFEVQLWMLIPVAAGGRAVNVARTVTDLQGHYYFNCLSAGNYFIVVPDAGDFVVSPYVNGTGDPNFWIDNDNNLLETPPISIPLLEIAASSNPYLLLPAPPLLGKNEHYLLDGAFTCEDRQIDVVLVMDSSGSMGTEVEPGLTRLDAAKQAATAFVNNMSLPPQQVSVIDMEDSPSVTELSSNRTTILEAINDLTVGGGTRIDLAIAAAVEELDSIRHTADIGVIIILSDGEGNEDPDDTVRQAARAKAKGYRVIAVGLGEPNYVLLKRLTKEPQDYYEDPTGSQLLSIYTGLVPKLCEPDHGSNLGCSAEGGINIPIRTGWDEIGNIPLSELEDLMGVCLIDSDWNIELPAGGDTLAITVDPVHPDWRRLDGGDWISQNCSGTTGPSSNTFVYRHEFDLASIPRHIELRMELYADDRVLKVEITNSAHPEGYDLPMIGDGWFMAPVGALVYSHSVAGEPNVFAMGTNILRVFVEDDYGYYSGLNVSGSLTACDVPDGDISQQCREGILDGRKAAVQYAQQYALAYNECWTTYGGSDTDCANFMSQALFAGGHDMITPGFPPPTSELWYMYDNGESSKSWRIVTDLRDYLMDEDIGSRWQRLIPNRTDADGNFLAANVRVGDLIFYDWPNDRHDLSHVGMVVDVNGQHNVQPPHPITCANCMSEAEQSALRGTLVSYHTRNRNRVLWNARWAEDPTVPGPDIWNQYRFFKLSIDYPTDCSGTEICPPRNPFIAP